MAGALADWKHVDALLLHNVMMIMGGLACIFNMFATTYASMCAFCAFFGLSVGEYRTLNLRCQGPWRCHFITNRNTLTSFSPPQRRTSR